MVAWHSAQNEDAAAVALAYLAAIDHKSACIESAQTLLEEISAKVGENIARSIRWQEEDRELNRERIHADVDLKRAEIDALRDLALAQFVLGPALENLAEQQPAPIIDLNAPDGDTPTPPTPQSDEQ